MTVSVLVSSMAAMPQIKRKRVGMTAIIVVNLHGCFPVSFNLNSGVEFPFVLTTETATDITGFCMRTQRPPVNFEMLASLFYRVPSGV